MRTQLRKRLKAEEKKSETSWKIEIMKKRKNGTKEICKKKSN